MRLATRGPILDPKAAAVRWSQPLRQYMDVHETIDIKMSNHLLAYLN